MSIFFPYSSLYGLGFIAFGPKVPVDSKLLLTGGEINSKRKIFTSFDLAVDLQQSVVILAFLFSTACLKCLGEAIVQYFKGFA